MAQKKSKKKGSSASSSTRTTVLLDSFTADALDQWQVLSAAEQHYHDRVYFDLELQRTTHHDALCAALESIEPTAVTLDPPWCRITDWTWNLTPLSSAGSVKGIGQRFNIGVDLDRARGQAFSCLYIAQDEKTARLEKFGPLEHSSSDRLSTYDFALRTPESFVTFAVTGHVDAVLDLRSHAQLNAFTKIIKRFSISAETKRFARKQRFPERSLIKTSTELWRRLMAPPEWRNEPQNFGIPAPNQIFGRYVRDAGFDGILYPSRRGGNLCLALFPENFSNSTSEVKVSGEPPAGATQTVLNKDDLCL